MKIPNGFSKNPAASEAEVAAFQEEMSLELPQDYISFLLTSNGGRGVGYPGVPRLYSLSEGKEANDAYGVARYLPGALLIGTDGGGEAFAYDLRGVTAKIVLVPFIGMEWSEAFPIASNFASFLTKLERGDVLDVLDSPERGANDEA